MAQLFHDPVVVRCSSATGPTPPKDVLAWTSGDVRADLRLLEVSEDVLEEIIIGGVVIKGGAGDEAVLCSKSKTFSVKYVETSNTQLLLSPSMQDAVPPDSPHASQDTAGVSATQALRSPAGLQTQLAQMRGARERPPLVVGAVTKAHLELSEIRPRLHKLHELLGEHPYGLEDEGAGDMMADEPQQPGAATAHHDQAHDADSMDLDPVQADHPGAAAGHHTGYTFQQLLAQVQASECQLRDELQALHALQLDGRWRLVDPTYLGQLLQLIMASADAEGWPLSRIPAQRMCDGLTAAGYRPELIRHCLQVYSTTHPPEYQHEQQEQQHQGSDDTYYCLDKPKVCCYLAQQVLSGDLPGASRQHTPCTAPGKPMAARQFLSAWHQRVPTCLHPLELELLKGQVLVEGKGSDAQVRLFQVSQLPTDPKARFTILFSVRPQWEEADLEPYLVGLNEPGFTGGVLLLKYARASQPVKDGPLYYTAR